MVYLNKACYFKKKLLLLLPKLSNVVKSKPKPDQEKPNSKW